MGKLPMNADHAGHLPGLELGDSGRSFRLGPILVRHELMIPCICVFALTHVCRNGGVPAVNDEGMREREKVAQHCAGMYGVCMFVTRFVHSIPASIIDRSQTFPHIQHIISACSPC